MSHGIDNKNYIASKQVISRRNQDGTIILMRLDENSLFYKIDGIAAQVWAEFEIGRNIDCLVQYYADSYCERYKDVFENFQKSILEFISQLLNYELLIECIVLNQEPFRAKIDSTNFSENYRFGSVQEFNLEQIETEVLNESIYLDVFAGSDLKLKHKVLPIQNALAKVIRLDGIQYQWNPKFVSEQYAQRGQNQIGLIAQQVAEQMPELVRKDASSGNLAIQYSKLTSYLVEAIKELHGKVEELEKKLGI